MDNVRALWFHTGLWSALFCLDLSRLHYIGGVGVLWNCSYSTENTVASSQLHWSLTDMLGWFLDSMAAFLFWFLVLLKSWLCYLFDSWPTTGTFCCHSHLVHPGLPLLRFQTRLHIGHLGSRTNPALWVPSLINPKSFSGIEIWRISSKFAIAILVENHWYRAQNLIDWGLLRGESSSLLWHSASVAQETSLKKDGALFLKQLKFNPLYKEPFLVGVVQGVALPMGDFWIFGWTLFDFCNDGF